jgi:hypothetical protein
MLNTAKCREKNKKGIGAHAHLHSCAKVGRAGVWFAISTRRASGRSCTGMRRVHLYGKSNPRRGNGKCKGPQVVCLTCSRNSEIQDSVIERE